MHLVVVVVEALEIAKLFVLLDSKTKLIEIDSLELLMNLKDCLILFDLYNIRDWSTIVN